MKSQAAKKKNFEKVSRQTTFESFNKYSLVVSAQPQPQPHQVTGSIGCPALLHACEDYDCLIINLDFLTHALVLLKRRGLHFMYKYNYG